MGCEARVSVSPVGSPQPSGQASAFPDLAGREAPAGCRAGVWRPEP
jgi:hypothetical protein